MKFGNTFMALSITVVPDNDMVSMQSDLCCCHSFVSVLFLVALLDNLTWISGYKPFFFAPTVSQYSRACACACAWADCLHDKMCIHTLCFYCAYLNDIPTVCTRRTSCSGWTICAD